MNENLTAKQKRQIQKKRKIRRQIIKYSRICLLVIGCCMLMILGFSLAQMVEKSHLNRMETEVSSAQDRLAGFLEQNEKYAQSQQALEFAVKNYENKKPENPLSDQVFTVAQTMYDLEKENSMAQKEIDNLSQQVDELLQQLGRK